MDERLSSEDESFEFVDAIEDESTDYVIPTVTGSIAVREIFGSEILVDENRPDHSLLVSSLDDCQINVNCAKFITKKTVNDGKACHDQGTKNNISSSKKVAIGSLENKDRAISNTEDFSHGESTSCDCGSTKTQSEQEFDKFNHFSITQSYNSECKNCKTEDENNQSVSCPKGPLSSQNVNDGNQCLIISNQSNEQSSITTCIDDTDKFKTLQNESRLNVDIGQVISEENLNIEELSNQRIAKSSPCDTNQDMDRLDQRPDIHIVQQESNTQNFTSKPNVHQNTTCEIGSNKNAAETSAANNRRKRSLHLDCKKTYSEEEKKHDGMFSPSFKREKPLCREEFQKMFDEDGRIVDEHALRKAVFMGGVDPSIRKEVWHFLFGFFPCSSTTREREDLLIGYIVKYHEQKSRWKTMLMLNAKPGASLLEQGLVARYQIDTSNSTSIARSPDGIINDPISEFEVLQNNLMAGKMKSGDPDFKTLSKNFPNLDIASPELKQKVDFMKIQAQVLVNRHNVNVKNLWSQLRVIDKDVPRTDRDQDYFKGALNPNLTVLREILITFGAFYPKIGYAQGMNDILARFLVVFDSEVETYWCFSIYMSKIQEDFTEDGMVRKIELVVELLEEMDLQLLNHLRQHDMGNLMFCHRWLLLGFKREMSFLNSLRCFEILSSHHLELSSLEAETARRKQTMKEFENLGGITRTTRLDTESEYTFELFMCLALLEECREDLLQSTDTATVFTVINNVKIDLDDVLCKSADLFYKYCKKSVDDSFLMVEIPSSSRRKQRSVFR